MYSKKFPELRKEAKILQQLGLKDYEISFLIRQREKQIIREGWKN